jgi:hypothetical protein
MASVHGTPERAPGSAGGVGACHACQTRLSRHRLRANYPRQRALTWQVALVSLMAKSVLHGQHTRAATAVDTGQKFQVPRASL